MSAFNDIMSNAYTAIVSIALVIFTNVSWSVPGFPTRVNTSADPVRPGFEDHDLDSVGSQDRGSTKTGDAGTDYDHFLLVWYSILCGWLDFLWTHSFRDTDMPRFFRV